MSNRKKFQIHDFIENYPSQDDGDIQWKIAERKEFYELQSTPKGTNKYGRFFNHQEVLLRYARQYDRIFNIQATGTGKTGGIINLAEFYKKNNEGIKRIYVIEPGSSTKDAFKEQIRKLSDPEEYRNQKIIKALGMEDGKKILKNNLNRLIADWYSIDTYKVFSKDNYSDEQIIEKYSDCVFFLDEVHWFRNTVEKDEETKREKEEIYNYFWKIFHLAPRIKVIIASATPMINSTVDFVPLINLLLPKDRQLPDTIDYNLVTLPQLEPYFRGLFTFIRFDNKYINRIDVGESLDYKHTLEVASNAKGNSPPLPPIKKEIIDGRIVSTNKPKYKEVKTKTLEIPSFVKLILLPMSKHQYKTYEKYSKVRKNFDHYSKQASLFVFPNGTTGGEGEKIYLKTNEKLNFVFKDKIRRRIGGKLIDEKSLKEYFNPSNKEEALENLKEMSTKFHFFIKNELENAGSSFCFIESVTGSGAKLLGIFLSFFGFEQLKSIGGAYDIKTSKITGIRKKRRFILLTSEVSDIQSYINFFNSPSNMNGEYVQILIGSKVIRDGVNLKNVVRAYIMGAGWHESGMHQATSRVDRADSHVDMFNKLGEKVDLKIYRLAAVEPNYRGISKTIDVKNYLRSEEKDISNKRIFQFMIETAFDAYLNYMRNVLPSDKPFSPQTNYGEKYFKIWGAEDPPSGAPGLPKPTRNGLALNQGPSAYDVEYTTYNIFYSNEVIKNIKQEIINLFKKTPVIDITTFKEKLRENKIVVNDYTFFSALEELFLNKEIIKDSRNVGDYTLAMSGNLIYLKRFEFHQTHRISTNLGEKFFFDFQYLPILDESNNLKDIYKNVEGILDREDMIRYYIRSQNYNLFKRLLEDSLIRVKNGEEEEINKLILSLLDNYILETKIPHKYLEETRRALSGEDRKGQGRLRGEKSKAGLKYLKLENYQPGYEEFGKTVYLHFYRASEKTGFGITSILEGKERKIRILEDGNEFRDTDLAENFVYNFLFDRKYDILMKNYRSSKYYGTYILRGGEMEKTFAEKELSFFRIVDNRNPRNKGLVCKTGKLENLKPVLKFLDKEKLYTKMLKEKVKKVRLCEILKELFEERNLLFFSL
jgi:hypothetical protein